MKENESKRAVVCVDVDGTLFHHSGEVNADMVMLIKILTRYCDVYVWSGGGSAYAKQRARDAKVQDYIVDAIGKLEVDRIGRPDITFDDADYLLGKVNIKI